MSLLNTARFSDVASVQQLVAMVPRAKSSLKTFLLKLLRMSPWVCVVLIGMLLVYKYRKNRTIRIVCKQTHRNKLVLERLAEKIREYSPTPYLPFALMKVAFVADRKLQFLDDYLRMDFKLKDGEVLPLDWYPRDYKSLSPDTPIVVFVPGIFGTSYDRYSLEFCKMLHQTLGWRSFVLNRRVFMNKIQGNTIISYFHFEDWREIIDFLHQEYPKADVFLAGVSMGALNIQKYLIQYSSDPKVAAAVTISSPFDASESSRTINNNILLNKAMHSTTLSMFRQNLHHPEFVDLCKKKGVNIERVLNTKTFREFDWEFCIKELNLKHPEEYYELLSSHKYISKISVPVLSVNSEDDPIIPTSNIPFKDILQNPNFIQIMVAGGGHIEYFHGFELEFVASALTSSGLSRSPSCTFKTSGDS